MLTNSKKECPFTDEIVSYMYGELGASESGIFEMHLADCATCTDDFAAISDSRFSVFEWRKEEFDRLKTPVIVIPELSPAASVNDREIGWFGALAGLLSMARSPLALAAVLLSALGVGFVGLSYFSESNQMVASNRDLSVPVVKFEQPDGKQLVMDAPVPDQIIAPAADVTSNKRRLSSYGLPAGSKTVVRNKLKRAESPRIAKKPVLNDFEDDTDDSLRLTALLDVIGG
jgi:hypothetical protein